MLYHFVVIIAAARTTKGLASFERKSNAHAIKAALKFRGFSRLNGRRRLPLITLSGKGQRSNISPKVVRRDLRVFARGCA